MFKVEIEAEDGRTLRKSLGGFPRVDGADTF